MTFSLLMIQPLYFCPNNETMSTNSFQKKSDANPKEIQKKAIQEWLHSVDFLRKNDISVYTFDDTPLPHTPDSLFPNNWISFHEDGTVVLYPMLAKNRREERRLDIIEGLKQTFEVREVVDLSHFEKQQLFLEGTGSLVLDYKNKIAFANHSPRTHEIVAKEVVKKIGYQLKMFSALDRNQNPIYHTNVVMSLGNDFVVICEDAIPSPSEKKMLLEGFEEKKQKKISIHYEQMEAFAGNIYEVQNIYGEPFIAISTTAIRALSLEQKKAIESVGMLLPLSIPTIETVGGGSVRCMMADIRLPRKQNTEW